MTKLRDIIVCNALFLLLILSIFVACSTESDIVPTDTSYHHPAGISFDFPEGWSKLSPKEVKKFESDKTLLTIMDDGRKAGFSLIAMNAKGDVRFALNLLGDEPAAKAAMTMQSIIAVAPKQYEEFELISHDAVLFAGVPMAELIFEGRNPGKEKKWHRILILTGGGNNDTILMIYGATPVGEEAAYTDDFKAIEESWSWK